MSFLDRLKNEILIADGAMGTLLYSYGKDKFNIFIKHISMQGQILFKQIHMLPTI